MTLKQTISRSIALFGLICLLAASSSTAVAATPGKNAHTNGTGWAPAFIILYGANGQPLTPTNACPNGAGSTPYCAPQGATDFDMKFSAHKCQGKFAVPPITVVWTVNGQLVPGVFGYMPCKAVGLAFNWNSSCQILSFSWVNSSGQVIGHLTPPPGANDAHIMQGKGIKIVKIVWTKNGTPLPTPVPVPTKNPPTSTGWGN